jgi:hypothetical protein
MISTGQKTSKSNDLRIGSVGERKMLERLRKDDPSFIQSTYKYEKWDFKNDKDEYWEGKTRTNWKDKYDTTFMPTHKVLGGKTQFFMFNFTDCMCYIKYDEKLFNTFETRWLMDTRDGMNKVVPHYCIPINLLTDM